MLKIALVVVAVAGFSLTVFAGPQEEAQAVAEKFVAAFVAGDLEATTALFAPDASLWGTISPELATDPDVVRKYFADNYAARAKVPLTGAKITSSSISVLSDSTVLIAGRWQTERPTATSFLRYTFVVNKRDGQWRIVHLNSSLRPMP